MSHLLIIKHDGGTWAYQVDNDSELKDRIARDTFGKPKDKLTDSDQISEVQSTFRELVDNGEISGEQWSMEFHHDGGVGGWTAEKAVLHEAKELFLRDPYSTLNQKLSRAVRELIRVENED